MLFKYPFFSILFLSLYGLRFTVYGFSKLATEDLKATLFKNISRQSYDHSCGPAAIIIHLDTTVAPVATIFRKCRSFLQGMRDGPLERRSEEKEFSLLNLKHAAEKLGHKAEWRKIKPKFLSMILQSVILLTELDTPSPHFVVLKEFRNGEAFLADPDRGNIRVTYDHLVEEGTNEEYSSFYAMAIKTPLISNQKVIEQARILP
uniref:Peptidase C39 family protein n=1 Tax=Candidatus Kentrum sp. LFY TaxID=2126342 RepID=A0A450WV39_9GAMM|nr:MAG: Peptidase C39 family protein [Candidatus Kentron sp. LFY]